ncbi:MAG: transcriptional repressor [Actinomycetota bacterium]|nr:transcriptional repressor [Actinomycetota bacterium]
MTTRASNHTPRVAHAVATLREHGERITTSRRAVIDVLDSTDEHLTADEIAERAADMAPGVHRTTVYRALATLGEIGLVIHTHIAGSATIYHLASSHDESHHVEHAHVQCTSCGSVIDVAEHLLEPVAESLADDIGFRVDVHHAALLGTCASCLSSQADG